MLFTMSLNDALNNRLLSIQNIGEGWDVREERDRQIVRSVRYRDWHHVECAMAIFKLESAPSSQSTRG